MKSWYALHTKPHVERRVAEQLDRWDIETFVPGTESQDRGRRAGFRPLFPGYLFIRVNLEKQATAAWLNFPGVRYIVAYDNEPVPVLDEVVSLLKRKVAEFGTEHKKSQSRFKPGGLVRIKDGPFRDMLAVFEGADGAGQRVRVLLQALERSMRLQLPSSDLDPADGAAKQRARKRPRRTRGRGRPIRS